MTNTWKDTTWNWYVKFHCHTTHTSSNFFHLLLFTVVHIVKAIAREVPIEIFITGETGRHNIELVGTSKTIVQQSLVAIMAFGCTANTRILHDTNINQWVWETHTSICYIFMESPTNNFYDHCRLLKRGSMFILSEEQFKNLLMVGGFNVNSLSARKNEITILDIGAGDGEVTMRLAKSIIHMNYNIFLKVFATEYSWTMRDRLQEKQFMWVLHP